MRQSSRITFWTASLAIATALFVCSEPLMAFAQFKTPKRGIPGRREPAGSREPRSCIEPNQDKGLVGLVPASNRSVTISAYPTLMFYIPQHRGKSVYFELRDEKNTEILHTVNFQVPLAKDENGKATKKSIPGVYSVTLSPSSATPGQPSGKPLAVDKTYLWYMVINCGQVDPKNSENFEVYTGGWLKRVSPSADLAKKLQRAKLEERPALLATNGIWNETISTLAMLRQKNPNNPSYSNDWNGLLKSVGLGEYAEQPLFDCCKPNNQAASGK